MTITPDSLLVGGSKGWHKGEKTITFSFITSVPTYYQKVDTNDDGRNDSYLITDGDPDAGESDFTVPFGKSVVMTATETAFARKALAEWAGVANINLVEVKQASGSKVADITLGAFKFANDSTYGFVADFPDGSVTGTPGRLGQPSINGDFWLNRGMPDQNDAAYGNTGWQTYLHELGHAFGLHHPDDEGEPAQPVARHNNQYTVMSYVPHPSMADLSDAEKDWPITPMLYDIAAIQKLYGANLQTRTGNTTYFGPDANAAYALDDGGFLENGRLGILTVWDAGGIDTIDASNQTGAVKIDLNPGAFSTIGDFADNVAMSLAHTVNGIVVNLIENATGGSGRDTLTGNGAANVLDGRAGADTMRGNAGNDTYVVDNVGDRVIEAANQGTDLVKASVTVSLAGQNVENLILIGTRAVNGTGQSLDNSLTGNGAANVLNGGLGKDVLKGLAGTDTFVFDTALGSGNVDRIADFSVVDDTIRLENAIFKGLATAGLSAKAFKDLAAAKLDADDRILYDHDTGSLSYDSDGSGSARAVQFALLDNTVLLTHADFFVV